MKNISIQVGPYTAFAPPPQPTSSLAQKVMHSVSFSAQFDSEEDALSFAAFLINEISEYRIRKDSIDHDNGD